jgi:hypothetical protein
MEKNTVEKPVVMQEVKTLTSRVNVTTWHVRSRFDSSLREVPLAWSAENDRVLRPGSATGKTPALVAQVKSRRRSNCEAH